MTEFKLVDCKVGDVTPNGFEIVEIYSKPVYKMRKRIQIKDNVYDKTLIGQKGYLYCDGPHSYIQLDGDEHKTYKFRDTEYDAVN